MWFAIPVFLGAFLIFQVQPLLARRILAWFGGGASVWTACMLFFQAALLGGYLYAHWAMRRLRGRWFAGVHGALLVVSLAFLPLMPDERWKPSGPEEPVWRILLLLTATVGLPYLVLASTSPVMQALFSRRYPGRSPWRLFALSNLGSMLGLLSYPVAVEPFLALREQSWMWSGLFVAYAICAAIVVLPGQGIARSDEQAGAPPPDARTMALWVALAAFASVLLLASTNYLTQNVPPTPFLWILPLAAYLLSFILVFDGQRWYRPALFRWLMPLALLALAATVHWPALSFEVALMAGICTVGVLIASVWCHGELVARKPAEQHLTRFYLMISTGGALGGLLVGVGAPLWLPGTMEFPLALAGLALFALLLDYRKDNLRDAAYALTAILVFAVTLSSQQQYMAGSMTAARNFYGSLRVQQKEAGGLTTRTMVHGMISHGSQVLEQPRVPTAYYAKGTGVDIAIERTRRAGQRVGVIGLGTGTLALAYGRAGDLSRFYEINPEDIRLASEYFTWLKGSAATTEVVAGDGRLSLEREAPGNYDVLAVDAFSGDSVPVHLLTREAIALYLRHLAQGGILALHISNTALDLEPVVAALVRLEPSVHGVIFDPPADAALFRSVSKWALISRDATLLKGGRPLRSLAGLRVWTDDYSSLWPILR